MTTTITSTQAMNNEIVLQERVTTNEYRISEIREDIVNKTVEVQVELGPFETVNRGSEENPDVRVESRGGRRWVQVWQGGEYESIRDSWTNTDLIAAVAAKMNQ